MVRMDNAEALKNSFLTYGPTDKMIPAPIQRLGALDGLLLGGSTLHCTTHVGPFVLIRSFACIFGHFMYRTWTLGVHFYIQRT